MILAYTITLITHSGGKSLLWNFRRKNC